MSCTSWKCESSSFREAIARADFDVSEPTLSTSTISIPNVGEADISSCQENLDIVMAKQSAIFTTHSVTCPSVLDLGDAQMIKFGTGLKFVFSEDTTSDNPSSKVVFPCIFGNRLEGAILLATGTMPINVPFLNEGALRGYYEKLDDVVFIVDEQMTDNARNLAASWRINALFVLQLTPTKEPTNADEVLELLNGANINAVTALAGPQSLVLIQISDKLYFYRGLADISFFDTSAMPFGADVTSAVVSLGLKVKLDPRIRRIVNLDDTNSVLMPASGQWVKPQDLPGLLEKLPIEQIEGLKNDVLAAVSQLQVILSQKEVVELSTSLIRTLSAKVDEVTAPHKASYINFVTKKYNIDDPESVKKKNQMLGKLRMKSKVAQNAVGSMVSSLGNMVSTQTTSKRAHDLKRLVRQAQIQNNVDAAHSMTFETLAEYLETYAESMGVMLLNINSAQYKKLLGTLQSATIDAK